MLQNNEVNIKKILATKLSLNKFTHQVLVYLIPFVRIPQLLPTIYGLYLFDFVPV